MPLPTKLSNRLARIDWRSRGKVPGKKGPKANRYAHRAAEIVARQNPGGLRWKRLKDLAK